MAGALEELRRWEAFGGTAEVVSTAETEVVVALCRCDGGEQVGRVVLTPAEAQEWAGS